MAATCAELLARLDDAVAAGSIERITHRVKTALEDVLGRGLVDLPDRYREARADAYARRLWHRDPSGRYSAIVMTWGRGQRTPVHDHGGLWCVEGVIEGRIAVTHYDVSDVDAERVRVSARETVTAGAGAAGRLIPPADCHVIANAETDRPSLTLHVYGGDLIECTAFEPVEDGLHVRRRRRLALDE